MLEVKINGSAEEIAALFQRLGGAAVSTIQVNGSLSDIRAIIDPLDNPAAGADIPKAPPGPEVFGTGIDLPSEADGHPGPEVFGGALASVGAAPSSTAPVVMPGTSTASMPLPSPTNTSQSAMPVPSPSAQPSASAAPAAAPPLGNHAGAVELDVHGLPWDKRIHADSVKKIADGSWKVKRNLDPAVKTAVEAELRQLMAFPTPGAAPVPNAPPPPPASSTMPMPVTAATPTPGAAAIDFNSLFMRTTAGIAAGTFTAEQLGTMLTRVAGTAVMPMLINRPDTWEAVAANLAAMGA